MLYICQARFTQKIRQERASIEPAEAGGRPAPNSFSSLSSATRSQETPLTKLTPTDDLPNETFDGVNCPARSRARSVRNLDVDGVDGKRASSPRILFSSRQSLDQLFLLVGLRIVFVIQKSLSLQRSNLSMQIHGKRLSKAGPRKSSRLPRFDTFGGLN